MTLKDVNVEEPCHGWSRACRVVARRGDIWKSKDVRLHQGYGATVSALVWRRERRLEVRGFEPLAFSLRTRRSTS
jgi:hypothetical protein